MSEYKGRFGKKVLFIYGFALAVLLFPIFYENNIARADSFSFNFNPTAPSDLFPEQAFELKDISLSRTLQLAEHYYSIPICVEVLEDRLGNEGKLITLKNDGMSLKGFLDQLVSIRSEYQWAQVGRAVVVYPKSGAKTDAIIDCTFESTSLGDLYEQIRTRINSVIQEGGPVGIDFEIRSGLVSERLNMQRPMRLEKGRITLRECLCIVSFLDEDLQIDWAYCPGVPGGVSDLIVIHFFVGGRYAGGDTPKEYLKEKAKILSKPQ